MRFPRSFIVLALVSAPFLPGTAAAAPAEATPSKIERVTVYEDRALVTRAATTDVAAGLNEVRIDGLPTSLDRDAVTVRCPEARVLGIDVRNVHVTQAPGAVLREAEQALHQAQLGVRRANLAQDALLARHSFLTALRTAAGKRAGLSLGRGGAPDVASLQKLLSFVAEQEDQLAVGLLDAEDALTAANETLAAAQRRVNDVRGGGGRTEVQLVISLEADAAVRAHLTVQYLVAGAAWSPSYDLRVSGDFDGAQLGLTGVVAQTTGEDWEGVELELTTARPATGAAPPELPRWVVQPDRPKPAAKARPMADAGVLAEKADRWADKDAEMEDSLDMKKKEVRSRAFQPQVRRSGVVVAFVARTPETIRSDGQPARVGLARWDLAPAFSWVAHPDAMDKVFVIGKVANTTGSPLPGGAARVFLGPDFVGRMNLEDWGIGKETALGLGVDREVEVEREVLDESRSTEGVFSKDVVHVRSFRISVTNHRDRAVSVVLREPIPVSTDEDIEVEVTGMSRQPAALPEREAETNEARGILEWHYDVASGDRDDLHYSFEVRHPKDVQMVGLER